VYKYEVEYESKHETVGLTVLPIAGEVNVALFTKRPPRFIRLSLGDVSKIKVVREDEGQRGIEVHFANETVQTLTISLFPVVMLFWGNLRATGDDRPSWERD
jgi:hypothetical protein